MHRAGLLRLLELAQRRLGGLDARVEIGGADPTDPALITAALPGEMRLVVVFEQAPDGRDELHAQLQELVAGFAATLADSADDAPAADSPANLPRRRLDDALEALRAHVRAECVVIMDTQSPVLWGSSAHGDDEDVDELEELGRALARAEQRGLGIGELLAIASDELAERLAGAGLLAAQVWSLERALQAARAVEAPRGPLALARAVFEVRAAGRAGHDERTASHGSDPGLLSRGFANIYRLVAVFEDDFSELHVESALLHAIPTMEQLLFALPPVDPPPKAGKVMRLPSRK